MDGADRTVRRPALKERLGFNLKGLGCFGAKGGLGPTTINAEEGGAGPLGSIAQDPVETGPACEAQSQPGMNLAAALTAERQLLGLGSDIGGGTPGRVSLMRLLEDTDGCDGEMKREEDGGWVCCVCMGRKKGAAFIPCGHTFCRVCSREMRFSRGSCPLCNRPILQILDIY